MAWTRKAPNDRVKGCWRDHTGKERSKTFATKTEALRYARKMEVEVQSGIRRDAEAGKQRFGDYLDRWMQDQHKIRHNTRVMYEGSIRRHILPSRLADRRLQEIEPRHVRDWIAERAKAGTPPATMLDTYQIIVRALYTAVNDEIIPKNPAIRLRKYLPEVVERAKRQPSREEVDAIAEIISPPWYRVAVLVLGYAGIRQGELAGLEVQDVDEQESCLWIHKQLLLNGKFGPPKNRRRSLSPARIQPWLLEEIKGHIAAGYTCEYQGKTLVFSSRRGHPPGYVNEPWKKYGIEDIVAWVGYRRQQDAADEIGVYQTTVSEWVRLARGEPHKWARRHPTPPVPTPFSRVGFFTAFKQALEELGLPPGIRAHDLRGAATSWMINELGIPIQIVAAQIGDDPMTLYKSYGQVTPEMHARAIAGLPPREGLGKVLELPAPVIEGEVVEG
jgi:integrase